jgi:hypothetical protein
MVCIVLFIAEVQCSDHFDFIWSCVKVLGPFIGLSMVGRSVVFVGCNEWYIDQGRR